MKSEWAQLLQESLTDKAEKVPAGWDRVTKIANDFGLSESHTRRVLKDLVTSGKAEARSFKVPMLSGVVKPIPHFRIRNDKRTRGAPRANQGRGREAD